MRTRLFKAACIFAGAALIATPAQADRRTSLAGNDLIEDADDAFLFPQTLHRYQNRLVLDLGMAAGSGTGLFSLGNGSMTFGAAIHRGPQEQSTIGWQDRNRELLGQSGFGIAIPDDRFSATPAENIDLLWAMQLNPSLDIGLRMGLARGLAWSDNQIPEDGGQPGDTRSRNDSLNQNVFHLTLGGSYKAGALSADAALKVRTLSGTKVDDGEADITGSGNAFGLASRVYYNLSKGFDIGTILGLDTGSGWVQDSSLEDTVTSIWSGTEFVLGVGPRIQIEDGPLVAAYGVIGYSAASADPDNHPDADEDTTNESGMLLPGFRMAGEYPVRPWMKVRAGMEYAFTTTTSLSYEDSDWSSDGSRRGLARNAQTYGSEFGWNAGLGFKFGALDLDATLNHGSLYFLWQDAPFAMVSATYHFGKLKAGAPRQRIERRAEPELKPVSEAEPAPKRDPEPREERRSNDFGGNDDF